MAAVSKRPWTAEELDRLPQGWRYEIDEGELVIMTPAGRRHGRIVAQVTHLLTIFVYEHRLGEVDTGEIGVYLQDEPETLRGVDVAFFSTERAEMLKGETGFVRVPPDLAVEVHDLSEPDMARKVRQYLKAGVRSVWVVDPEKESLALHRIDREPVVLTDPDSLVEDFVLPGFSCRLRELFGLD